MDRRCVSGAQWSGVGWSGGVQGLTCGCRALVRCSSRCCACWTALDFFLASSTSCGAAAAAPPVPPRPLRAAQSSARATHSPASHARLSDSRASLHTQRHMRAGAAALGCICVWRQRCVWVCVEVLR